MGKYRNFGEDAVVSPDRVDVLVAVEPAGLAVGVAQRDLAAVHDHPGLPPHDRPQPAVQASLELARHQRVMGASLKIVLL